METCHYGPADHLVDENEFNYALHMCHACAKLKRWNDQAELTRSNVRVEMLPNGHWKAFLLSKQGLTNLIASGHVKQYLYKANEVVLRKLLSDSIRFAVDKLYTPDEKYIFVGEIRVFLLDLNLNQEKINIILMQSFDRYRLPTLRMKAANWKLWLPKVSISDPQLRAIEIKGITVHESENPMTPADFTSPIVEDAVILKKQTNTPFCPAQLIFTRSGRYSIVFDLQSLGRYILDVDVTEKSG